MAHYYKLEFIGGERSARQEAAKEFGLAPIDFTGHAVVFVKKHEADLEVFNRNYGSIGGGDFEVEIEEIDKAQYDNVFS